MRIGVDPIAKAMQAQTKAQAAEDRFIKSVERALAAGLREHVLINLVRDTAHEVGKEDTTEEAP